MNSTLTDFLEECDRYRLVPVVKRMFADTTTPIQIFQRFQEEAVFLLESNAETSKWSRYSFVGLNVNYELIEKEEQFYFQSNDEVISSSDNFVSVWKDVFHYLNPSPATKTNLPFPGGAVGVLPYDSIGHFEKTAKRADANEPIHFLFCQTLLAYDHQTAELMIVHYVDSDNSDSLEELYEEANVYIERLVKQLSEPKEADFQPDFPVRVKPNWSTISSNFEKEQFLTSVNKVKDYIVAGDVFQAVISQRFQYETDISPFLVYRVLRQMNPSPYLFFIRLGTKTVVGSSPEKLVGVGKEGVEIHPIAGTRKRGATEAQDDALKLEMLNSEKERAEHQMLIDLARNDVGRVAQFGSVHVPKMMEVGMYSHVMHLVSIVKGKLRNDIHPMEALIAGYPAGTLSGAPKVRAMEILNELEPTNRGLYAGGILYMSYNEEIDSCIAIRTVVFEEGVATVQAGAGVVADSVPEEEYEESINKASALFSAIQTAETMLEKGAITGD